MSRRRIVVAYSGGLAGSAALAWLTEHEAAEIVALTLDVGQGSELGDVRERALSMGAVRAHLLDVREEFARQYVLPALQAGVFDATGSALVTALWRPLLASHLVRIAHMEGAHAVAYGCWSASRDRGRLAALVRALDAGLDVITLADGPCLTSSVEAGQARQPGFPEAPGPDGAHRVEANLWGRVVSAGALEDAWLEPAEDLHLLTRAPALCPNAPAEVTITFEAGTPTKISGVPMDLSELIVSLATIAGAHGVGRLDLLEHRDVDGVSRELHEVPAAAVLRLALRDLAALVVPADLERTWQTLGRAYADLVRDGRWFTPTRDAIDAFVQAVRPRLTGEVRLKLFKGTCTVAGRRSRFAIDHGRSSPLAAGSEA